MPLRLRHSVSAFFVASAALLEAAPAFAEWQTNVQYGENTRMDLYTPGTPVTPTPIVVTLHYCSGQSVNARWLEGHADELGFMIITPQAGGNCFDANPARSGERANIVAMVEYAIENHDGDPTRVFATGASSGACMTQALLAAYPDVFAAGSSLAGVPAGAWTSGNEYGWSTSGTSGGEAWGNKVRQASPDFTGMRPRVQLWHGRGDTTLTFATAYPPQVEQWTNVFGVDDGDAMTENVMPQGARDTWERTSYTSNGTVVVEANVGGQNVDHELTSRGLWDDVVRFFELDQAPPSGAGGMGGTGGAGGGGVSTGGAGTAGTASAGAGSGGTPASGGSGGTTLTPIAGSGGTGMGGVAGAGGTSTAGGAPTAAGAPTAGSAGSGGVAGTTTLAGTGGTPTAGRGGGFAGTSGGGAGPGSEPSDAPPAEDGGCSCRVGTKGEGAKGLALFALGLGGLGLLARRRR